MKRNIFPLLMMVVASTFWTCTSLQNVVKNLPTTTGTGVAPLTEADIANGLKEALQKGIDQGVNELIKPDGYFGNQLLKILMPPEAVKVQNLIVENVPNGQKLIDDLVLKMNRAAEDAANEAKPIFVNAITSMTITDAKNILFGNADAATQYLKAKTFQQLTNTYSPKINNSLSKVGAVQAWSAITNPYNKLANSPAGGVLGIKEPINSDLVAYVTTRALDGLFFKIAEEEKKIRDTPLARTTNLLQRVFGELDKKK